MTLIKKTITTYYKAVRQNGTDFFSGTVRWLPEDGVIPTAGWLVEHPTATHVGRDADTYLSVSTVAADCTGMEWPCRLLLVEPHDAVVTPSVVSLPHKRAAVAWRVVAELPAHEALGPQGEAVAAIIDRAAHLTLSEVHDLATAWNAVRDAAWDAAWDAACVTASVAARTAARYAARNAAWDAAWCAVSFAKSDAARNSARDAASDAVLAAVVRDLITSEEYDLLMRPWRVLEAS